MTELEKLMLNISFGSVLGVYIGLVIITIQNWLEQRID